MVEVRALARPSVKEIEERRTRRDQGCARCDAVGHGEGAEGKQGVEKGSG